MKKEEVIKTLTEAGIKVEERETLKDGYNVQSLVLGDGDVKPTIHQHQYEQIENAEELLKKAKVFLENAPKIERDKLTDKEFILENVISCIRHETADDKTVKFPVWGDLEEYFRVVLGMAEEQMMSYVINNELIEAAELDPEELRTHARMNTEKSVEIKSMEQVMAEMCGVDCETLGIKEEPLMYVATAHGRNKGASVMLLDSVLKNFCEEHGVEEITIIPSSTEEVLLVLNKDLTEQEINNMVNEVNLEAIDDKSMILSDHVYYYHV